MLRIASSPLSLSWEANVLEYLQSGNASNYRCRDTKANAMINDAEACLDCWLARVASAAITNVLYHPPPACKLVAQATPVAAGKAVAAEQGHTPHCRTQV